VGKLQYLQKEAFVSLTFASTQFADQMATAILAAQATDIRKKIFYVGSMYILPALLTLATKHPTYESGDSTSAPGTRTGDHLDKYAGKKDRRPLGQVHREGRRVTT
jgi:hypothetical protein